MSIRRFFAGQAFEPEAITKMSVALETVCSKLGLQVIDDTVTWRKEPREPLRTRSPRTYWTGIGRPQKKDRVSAVSPNFDFEFQLGSGESLRAVKFATAREIQVATSRKQNGRSGSAKKLPATPVNDLNAAAWRLA
jgi:hypothetical protein